MLVKTADWIIHVIESYKTSEYDYDLASRTEQRFNYYVHEALERSEDFNETQA
jgi:hypothetical protein